MKTNVNMVRKMGEFEVTQRTKDEMFNATLLLNQWNQYHSPKKEMGDFIRKKSTEEFIEALELEEILKDGKSHLIKSRGRSGGTWMSPLLFIDFAMWLNPAFKVKVLKFVYDELIKNRHSAGDGYVKLSASASKFPDVNYRNIAKAMNHIVFKDHKKGIRQNATEEQLKSISELEDKLSFAIDMGYIKTQEQLMEEMRTLWYQKHTPKF